MNTKGRFGKYGGQYVPEIVMPALYELEENYAKYKDDPDFQNEFHTYLREYAGRPTNLYYAKKLTEHYGKAHIFLKREDLLHTGAHKINNALGQALLAKRMGKKRIVAETGAGQHGVPRRRRLPHCSAWSAMSSWAPSMSSARSSTSSA